MFTGDTFGCSASLVNSVAKTLIRGEKFCHMKFEVRCVPLLLSLGVTRVADSLFRASAKSAFDLCTLSQPVESLDTPVSSSF